MKLGTLSVSARNLSFNYSLSVLNALYNTCHLIGLRVRITYGLYVNRLPIINPQNE